MLRSCLLLVCLSFCLTLTGCADSPEALMQDMVNMTNDMADDIEAGISPEELDVKYTPIGEELVKRAEKLSLSRAQVNEFHKKYEPEINKGKERVMKAAMKKYGIDAGLLSMPGGGGMF